MKPLNDRVLVKRLESEEKTAGGLYIPDAAKEKPSKGEVVACGPGKLDDKGGRAPMAVKPGDVVLFAKYAGTDITVSFSVTDDIPQENGKSESFIKIRIRDNGPGVDKDDLPLIAEKYYRGKNASDKSGYGLGMYLCKMYMNKQGGGMEYYNDGGFVVELVLRKV